MQGEGELGMGSRGALMMARMGWKEGSGLGKDAQGPSSLFHLFSTEIDGVNVDDREDFTRSGELVIGVTWIGKSDAG